MPADRPAEVTRDLVRGTEPDATQHAACSAQGDETQAPPRDIPDLLHRRVERQAQRQAEAIAVVCGTERLTYGALNAAANRLARRLRAAGIGPEQRVAVLAERSPRLVVALLAVLKAGGGYLPIDPASPADRIALLLADGRPGAVLADDPAQPALAGLAVPVLALEERTGDAALDTGVVAAAAPILDTRSTDPTGHSVEAGAGAGAGADLDDPPGTHPGQLAYVIYTSGSTGKPKGVQVEHRQVLRLFDVTAPGFGFGPADVWTLFHSCAFDFSVWELFGALTTGGRVVVVPARATRVPAETWALVAGQGVTVLCQTPSAFRGLIAAASAPAAPAAPALAWVIFGGEALDFHTLRPWAARRGLTRPMLVNMYGTTETTVHASWLRIEPVHLDEPRRLIGEPLPDLDWALLDAAGRPVPDGEDGELVIGGAGVARGYLERPALNTERFVPDPARPGSRRYRTGDLVRRGPDGQVEYRCRNDRQLKLRGHRIEPGEIEAVLEALPGIAQAVVRPAPGLDGASRLVAWVVAAPDAVADPAAWRDAVAARLPDVMRPSAYVPLAALPLTTNGKLDEAALPAPAAERPPLAVPFAAPRGVIEMALCAAFAETLGLAAVGRDDAWFDLGGDSLGVLRLVERIAVAGLPAPSIAMVFDAPTPAALALRWAAEAAGRPVASVSCPSGGRPDRRSTAAAPPRPARHAQHEPIAIIGMAGRFPGAPDLERYWTLLLSDTDGIRRFPPGELDPSIAPETLRDPAYVPARGVLDGIEDFEPGAFGMTLREAEFTDPQQRLLLELAAECLEHAGRVPAATESIGVFAGVHSTSYHERHLLRRPDRLAAYGEFQALLGNDKDFVATRIAHRLDLRGPAVSVHTACSTSLAAIALAVQSLRAGACGMALAGGASVTCPPASGYRHEPGAMLSPDGCTRPFDVDAAGTVFGDGGGVVLLKPLSAALADGDTVHAVIRGVAVNNDGGAKASFTAPSADGQAAVIAAALADAEVEPASVGYVEAHGTATPLGDPIELEGLARGYGLTAQAGVATSSGAPILAGAPGRAGDGTPSLTGGAIEGHRAVARDRVPERRLAIGSVKGHVGHLTAAAGVAGLIKTVLALNHERLPATLHHRHPHPALAAAGCAVVNQARDWPRGPQPRRAGISSFGVGGTNVHLILEEAPVGVAGQSASGTAAAIRETTEAPAAQLLMLSARSPAALAMLAERSAAWLAARPALPLADVAHTLQVGRCARRHCLAVVASSGPQAAAALRGAVAGTMAAAGNATPIDGAPGGVRATGIGAAPGTGDAPAARGWVTVGGAAVIGFAATSDASPPPAIWLFPGQGAAYPGMGRELHKRCPHFRTAWDEAVAALAPHLGFDLQALVFRAAEGALEPTEVAQPALFAIEVALARRWLALGLEPAAMVGHSVGEFAAAVIAGRLPLADAARLVASRGRLMQALPVGALLAVAADAEALQGGLPAGVFLVADNGPAAAVVGGTVEAVEAHARTLAGEGVAARRLAAGRAFHTPAMAPVVPPLAELLRSLRFAVPQRPLYSTVTGRRLLAPEALSGADWRRQPMAPVRWAAALAAAEHDHPDALLLEVGPGRTLSQLARPRRGDAAARRRASERRLASLGECSADEVAAVLAAEGRLRVHGLALASPMAWPPEGRRRVELPVHPWERQRCWIDAPAAAASTTAARDTVSLLPIEGPPEGRPARDAVAPTRRAGDTVASMPVAAPLPTDPDRSHGATMPIEPHQPPNAAAVADEGAASTVAALRSVFEELSGFDLSTADPATPFVELGLDSLMLTQAALQLRRRWGLDIAFRRLMTGERSLATLAAWIDRTRDTVHAAPANGDSGLTANVTDTDTDAVPHPPPMPPPATHAGYDVQRAFGAIARIHTRRDELNARQSARLATFVRRYVERTARSKAHAAEHRPHLADPRVVNGFRPLTKEIVYPLVVERSRGARLWDLDGHEYVDALNGFGMSLFGWQPGFVLDAVRAQLDAGFEIGPQHPLAGEVAAEICAMTGHERAAFCNTGSEAVMTALRIARTVSGRDTVVLFAGAYHGTFDEVLVRAGAGGRGVPAAPGVLPGAFGDVRVLDYGSPAALDWIRRHAGTLAAVLVEPVQSRRPDFLPREFLHELRAITAAAGCCLVFDEVITGFRVHPGGLQAQLGLRADLATYGKVLGGGLPIGVVAGHSAWLDALDGGAWRYGDDSVPEVGVTYFAGTFVRHPMALAAARAVLRHLREAGPALQQKLALHTAALVDELGAWCREVGAPITFTHHASLWRIVWPADAPWQELLFAMMRSRGVHILEHFPCFLTTAHGPAEIAVIKSAFKASVAELQEAGFLPACDVGGGPPALDPAHPPAPGARLGRDREGRPGWFIPDPAQPGKYMRVSP